MVVRLMALIGLLLIMVPLIQPMADPDRDRERRLILRLIWIAAAVSLLIRLLNILSC